MQVNVSQRELLALLGIFKGNMVEIHASVLPPASAPFSGEVRELSWVSTSAIRSAHSDAMVVMMNTMESIITDIRICTP